MVDNLFSDLFNAASYRLRDLEPNQARSDVVIRLEAAKLAAEATEQFYISIIRSAGSTRG